MVYLAQLGVHLIPMYLEPDAVYNAAACVMLPYMSLALGGAGKGPLHPDLKDMKMPVYRYLKEVDLPTYNMDVDLPLINRGAVTRFFSFPTQEESADVLAKVNVSAGRVYTYDIQVHTRTDALVDGKFDMTLPTNEDTVGYMILNKDGSYEPLIPKSSMLGYNVATVWVDEHGCAPFTINLDSEGNPIIGDGSNGTLALPLPPNDDLVGVQIVEVIKSDGQKVEGEADVAASVLKINASLSRLTITVTEKLADGSTNAITLPVLVSANSTGTYNVGPYSVSVAIANNVVENCKIDAYSGDYYKYEMSR